MRIAALIAIAALAPAGSVPQITLDLADYVTLPLTGAVDGKGQVMSLLARVNFMREEPTPAARKRIFLNDLNGPLYILDRKTLHFTTYLDFNGRDGRPGVFRRLPTDAGFANGFISFAFDPDYAHNGKFYTVHLEDPEAAGSPLPDASHFPGLNLAGYQTTAPVPTPGETVREAVIIEWTDTNISNTAFEGTAREVLRIKENTRIHPVGDLIFNPGARPGDPDWRVLYIASGDGGSGEQRSEVRNNPQRLDTLVGKILRIIPDPNDTRGRFSENGRYRIPDDNPFVSKSGARPEIWAYGLRNPARLAWDSGHLIANVIGLYTWETVVIIHKGANYGYSMREGNQALDKTNHTTDLPADDRIPVLINATATDGFVAPAYPVIQYRHTNDGGDAVGSGYAYRGKKFPALRDKYLFGDISTGKLWWADYKEMLAAEDGDPKTMAAMHPIRIRSNNEVYASMSPITMRAYHARGGKAPGNPGTAKVATDGRSDIHLWMDSSGDLYIISKSDGMIRKVVRVELAPGS